MPRPSLPLRAANTSAGRRWSPIPDPPPPNVDRLCGTHTVLNALRVFSQPNGHPHRRAAHRLFLRDFRLAAGAKRDITAEAFGVPSGYANLRRVLQLARALRVEVRWVERDALVRLCGERRHQNAVLETSGFAPHKVAAAPRTHGTLLFLERVLDPMNVGAICRHAFFFGVRDVVLSADAAKCTPAVSRASAGMLEHMRLYQSVVPSATFVENTLAQHAARGEGSRLEVYAATAHTVTGRTEGAQEKSAAGLRIIMLGNEDSGLTPEVLRCCTHTVHIPCHAILDEGEGDALRRREVSLNVSAASAIILASLLGGNTSRGDGAVCIGRNTIHKK